MTRTISSVILVDDRMKSVFYSVTFVVTLELVQIWRERGNCCLKHSRSRDLSFSEQSSSLARGRKSRRLTASCGLAKEMKVLDTWDYLQHRNIKIFQIINRAISSGTFNILTKIKDSSLQIISTFSPGAEEIEEWISWKLCGISSGLWKQLSFTVLVVDDGQQLCLQVLSSHVWPEHYSLLVSSL